MSALAKLADLVSPEEYIESERASDVRHEYVDGYLYAMAGASDNHNRITRNILTALDNALRGKPCEPFATDMKVKIPPSFADVYYYPDVVIVCDPTDNATYYRESPSIIFEVLSPDTEGTDRREKAIAYRFFPSLTAYILVEQDRMALTILHRAEIGWRKELLEGPDAVLKLDGLGVEIPLERIYERTAAARAHRTTA